MLGNSQGRTAKSSCVMLSFLVGSRNGWAYFTSGLLMLCLCSYMSLIEWDFCEAFSVKNFHSKNWAERYFSLGITGTLSLEQKEMGSLSICTWGKISGHHRIYVLMVLCLKAKELAWTIFVIATLLQLIYWFFWKQELSASHEWSHWQLKMSES